MVCIKSNIRSTFNINYCIFPAFWTQNVVKLGKSIRRPWRRKTLSLRKLERALLCGGFEKYVLVMM